MAHFWHTESTPTPLLQQNLGMQVGPNMATSSLLPQEAQTSSAYIRHHSLAPPNYRHRISDSSQWTQT